MRLFPGRNHHHFQKAERADSVDLSKLRIAKKRQQTQNDAAAHDVVLASPPDTDGPFTGNDQHSRVPPYTEAPPSPDLVVGEQPLQSEDEAFPCSFAASSAPLKDAHLHPDDPDDDTVVDVQVPAREVKQGKDVTVERKDSMELARNRGLPGSPRSLRRNARSVEERMRAEAGDGAASLRKMHSSGRTSPVLGSSSPQRPRPHSAAPAHNSEPGPVAMKRSQSIGANRGGSPRGDPRRRRASTGQHHGGSVLPEGGGRSGSGSGSRTMSRKSSDKGPLFDSPGLLRFLKHAFLPHTHHTHPAPPPQSHLPAGSTGEATPSSAAGGRSGALSTEHSAEKMGGGGGHGSSSPPRDSDGGRTFSRRSAPMMARGGSDSGGAEPSGGSDQGPVAAFFSKIHRATFKSRH